MKKRLLSAFLAVMMVLTMAPMAFAADGDADSSGAEQSTAVAKIGDVGYPTLQAAVDAANDGDIVQLLTDVLQNSEVCINKNITLDLAGKKIYNNEDIWNDGKNGNKVVVALINVMDNANVTITGNGVITAKQDDCYAINLVSGILTIENGNIVGNVSAVQVQTGHLYIKGGTFSLLQKWNNKSTFLINMIDEAYKNGSARATITGGTFVDYEPSQSTSENPTANFVPTGYEVTQQDDNYIVTVKPDNEAKVNDIQYATLADAIAVAQDNDTVTLLKDVNLSDRVKIEKNVDIDLGTHKLSREGYSLDIYGKTTLKNGTIEITQHDAANAVWVNKSANLTVEKNVTMISTDEAFALGFDKSCTTATVTFKGTITGGNGITMNGEIKDTATSNKLIVDGANIKVKGHGLYLAGFANTEFTINDSVISGATGIEIRAGKLNIANSSISGSGVLKCEPNKNGTTTDGAGIAIAQHTTKLPIDVTISDGEISGTYAIYESNPQNNDADSIAQIKLAVTGGKFKGALYSKDIKSFITGGLFSDDPSKYCGVNAEGQQLTGVKNNGDDTYLFTVGVAGADAAPVESATVPAQVDDKATETTKTAANEMTEGADLKQNNIIEAAVKDTANKNEITAASNVENSNNTVLDTLKTKTNDNTVAADQVQIVYQTYVDVKVSGAEKENNNYTKLSVDLTPMYRVIATTKAVYNSEADYVVDADGNNTGVNAIQVTEPKELSLPDKEYDIKLALPIGFERDNTALSVKHTKNGSNEFYKGITSEKNGKLYVNFTTKGFSPFEITKPAASIPDTSMVYPTLADAVNAVENGKDIVLLQDIADNDVATVTKNIKFRVLNLSNKKFDKDKNIVAGSYTTKTVDSTVDSDGNATHTYTFKYSKPSSGGSSGSSGGSSSNTFNVTTSAVNNGGVNASPSKAAKGKTITITLSPDKGYKLDKLTVTDGSGKSIATTKKSDTVYTFTMPASQVKVGVSYVKIDSEPAQTTGYSDVAANDWFADAVQYVSDKGMMNGTGKNTFGPQLTTTRGMIVTVLYRLEKEPAASAASFTDVASGEYYTNAVAWANANGIVSGYGNGKFGPNDTITREQLAAILYRYAQFKKFGTSASADLNSYVDAQSVSSYAVPAVQWACGAGIVNGKTGNKLDPKGSATRAEVAAMLMRFCENVK